MMRTTLGVAMFAVSPLLLVLSSIAGAQQAGGTEKYRVVAEADGLSCSFSQDLSLSLSAGFSGTMSAAANHFKCTDKAGKPREIELISTDPNKSAGLENGKVAIRTKNFGTVYRGNEEGKLDTYEMTDSQIKKLRAFLGNPGPTAKPASTPTEAKPVPAVSSEPTPPATNPTPPAAPAAGPSTPSASAPAAVAPAAETPEPPDKVVLKVGDQSITQEQIEKAIHALPPQAQNSLARQGKKPFGDEYVLMLVLSQAALSNHLDETNDYKETLALTRLKILAQQEYQQILQRAIVTPQDASNYFATHQSDFDELQVLQVTVRKKPEGAKEGTPGFPPDEAKARAEEIRQAFISGQDPKQVAEKFQMANVVRVDSQPFTIRRGQMRADMEKAAFNLKPGEISELLDFGMAVGFVKVISHQSGDLKSATAKIENTLRQQKINSALDALKANSKIWMDDSYFASPAAPQVPPKPQSLLGAPTVPK